MSTSGAESAHVQNKYPNDGGCQTMKIENMRKEKTFKKGSTMLDEPLLLDGRKNEKNQSR